MALSGIISNTCNGTNGANYEIWAEWTVNAQSTPNNYSNITVVLKLQYKGASNSTAYNLTANNQVRLVVQNQIRVTTAISIDTRNKAVVTLASWAGDIPHATDGTLSLMIGGLFELLGSSALIGGQVENSAIEVNAITQNPPNITVTIDHRDNKYVTLTFHADEMCDNWQYYLDGGGDVWIDIPIIKAQSFSWTIGNLTPLTQYAISVRARRYMSFAYGISAPQSFTTRGDTKVISYITSFQADAAAPTINTDIEVYSTTYTHTLEFLHNGAIIPETTIQAGTLPLGTYSKQFAIGSAQRAALLNYMKNVQTLQVVVRLIVKSGVNAVSTINLSLTALTSATNSKPLFTTFSFLDNLSTTSTVTGNNQVLIQGYSRLRVLCSAATPRNGASIVNYNAVCGNKSVRINNTTIDLDEISTVGSIPLTVTVTDSRGYTTTVQQTVIVTPYTAPKITELIVRRHNGVDAEIEADFEGNISPIDVGGVNKNSVTYIRYRVKKTNETFYGSYVSLLAASTITGNNFHYSSLEAMTLNADNSWNVQLEVRDALGSLSVYTLDLIIPQGTPLIAIRPNKVGINNPDPQRTLDVGGNIGMNGQNVMGFVRRTLPAGEDFNDIIQSGYYLYYNDPNYAQCTNVPGSIHRGFLEVLAGNYSLYIQRFTNDQNTMYIRTRSIGGTWSAWRTI